MDAKPIVSVASAASASLPAPVGAYSYARRAGGLLFLAGIGPRKAGTRQVPGVRVSPRGEVIDYDIEAQVRSCFENVREALRQHGIAWEKIVDVTVYMTDLRRDFATFNKLWSEYFPPGSASTSAPPPPTRTTIEVSSLPQAADQPINFEVKVIAEG